MSFLEILQNLFKKKSVNTPATNTLNTLMGNISVPQFVQPKQPYPTGQLINILPSMIETVREITGGRESEEILVKMKKGEATSQEIQRLSLIQATGAIGGGLKNVSEKFIQSLIKTKTVQEVKNLIPKISDEIATKIAKSTDEGVIGSLLKGVGLKKVGVPEVPKPLAQEAIPKGVATKEVLPPVKPPIPPTPPPKEMPQFAGEPVGDPIAKLNQALKEAQPVRKSMEKAYTAERAKRIGEVESFINTNIDNVGGEEGYKIILSKLKGELISPEAKVSFEPLKNKLTEADLKDLFLRNWKHPYLDNWEKLSVADGLTELLGGGIPQPKQLVLLEEVYGTDLIKNILNKRALGFKIADIATDILNIPRALLATADMSGFLRQGIIEVVAHPIIGGKAIGKTFQFAFSPKAFEQYFLDLSKDKLYPLMRKSGLAITDPSKAMVSGREEAFMSRLMQKIPVIGDIMKFAERSYTGFLTKLRVDVFKNWADELLSKGFSPIQDANLFKAVANIVNTFTGRGSLGKLDRIAPGLNTVFFSPRLIASRFNALNPIWYIKQPKAIRMKAISDFAKFVAVGLTTLALIKTFGGDEVEVETDLRSADSGKIKIDNTRWDIWGGFQQWARLFGQVITGERKTADGEIISLSKDEFPFTTRKEAVYKFFEGKLSPVVSLLWNELMGGMKTFAGEEVTPETITKEKFIPMYIQDIADAYNDNGLGMAVGVGIPAFFGVGVQTYGGKMPEFKVMDYTKVKTPSVGGFKVRNYAK